MRDQTRPVSETSWHLEMRGVFWDNHSLFNGVQPLIGKMPNQAVHNILEMKASGVLCPTQSSCLSGW